MECKTFNQLALKSGFSNFSCLLLFNNQTFQLDSDKESNTSAVNL